MDRGKLLAIITGAISILIAVAYLIVVQLLDFRGEMIPAPVSYKLPFTERTAKLTTKQTPAIRLADVEEDELIII
ncbi:hypothetical protein [Myxosarcina sp. GI1]|uniref:hypothetical protein n=1 Tax=Myxosarcina sp. GI1 TaxID=1541065 RepID=UPI0009DD34A3|nr:hypothetical protein [Myxosarcina sp. GI1]